MNTLASTLPDPAARGRPTAHPTGGRPSASGGQDLAKIRLDAANGRLATTFALIAMGMFFVGMVFVVLAIRRENTSWPPVGSPSLNPILLVGNTLVLLISSLTMHMAGRAASRPAAVPAAPSPATASTTAPGSTMAIPALTSALSTIPNDAMSRWLVTTSALGWLFLAGQVAQFRSIGGWRPAESIYRNLFQVMAGLHGAHVAAGLLLLAIVSLRARGGLYTAERHLGITFTTWFWHFVTVVWLVLMATVVGF